MIRTRVFYSSLWLALILCFFGPPLSAQETAPALKTYELPVDVKAADISPDERFVAGIVSRRVATDNPEQEKLVEAVQIWDFKNQKLIAERTLFETTLRKSLPTPFWPRLVKFSGDGQRLVVSFGTGSLSVLRLPDLEEVNRIDLELPQPSTLANLQFEAFACAMEAAPQGRLVAVRICQPVAPGALQMYDLESGRMLWQWPTGRDWGFDNGVAWRPDGQRLALARADRSPNLFVFEAQSGALLKVIRPGHAAGSIAFTPDNRLYTVDINPPGVVENRKAKVHIFDADTGKRLGTISHTRSGVRYQVSASRDGRRLLGYTGLQTLKWDWEGLAFFPQHMDSRFTVWDLRTMQEVFTSPDMGTLGPRLSLSVTGRYVLLVQHPDGASILQLPE